MKKITSLLALLLPVIYSVAQPTIFIPDSTKYILEAPQEWINGSRYSNFVKIQTIVTIQLSNYQEVMNN